MRLETPKIYFTYCVGGEEFKRKEDIIEQAKAFLDDSVPDGRVLEGKARAFFLDILHHHPAWRVKTQKRLDEEIDLKPDTKIRSYGLRIYHRGSGFRGDNISWREALKFVQKQISY